MSQAEYAAASHPPRRRRWLLASALTGLLGVLLLLAFKGALAPLLSVNYLPHRFCYLTQPGLIWTNVLTDATIALSYAMIFASLLWIAGRLRQKDSLRGYLWIFVSFGLFIAACGATHLMGIVTVWWPIYPMAAAVNLLCAAASLPTALLFTRRVASIESKLGQFSHMVDAIQHERDRALRALAESERQAELCRQHEAELSAASPKLKLFRVMIESVVDYAVFLLNPDGIVMTWNLGAERIKGYRPEEIIGSHFSVFYPPEAIADGLPQRELVIAARKGRYEEEGWRRRKDGSPLWARVTVTALRDDTGNLLGFGKVTRDLTELRKAEEALRESHLLQIKIASELAAANSYLRNIFNASTLVALIATDLKGTITVFNRGAELMLGYSSDEVIGAHTPALFHLAEEVDRRGRELAGILPRPVEGFDVFVSSIGRPAFDKLEWTYIRKNGEHLIVTLSLSSITNEAGEPIGYLGVAEDVTHRRNTERAIAAAYTQLNSVLECTSDCVMNIGRDWTMLYANNRTLQTIPDFKVGRNYWESFPATLGTPAEQNLRHAMETHTEVTYESLYEPYNIWFKVRLYPSDAGLSAFFTDITEEKRMQEHIALEQVLREKRIEALSHMAGGLAHEISNPLAIIHARASDLKASAEASEPISPADLRKASESIIQTSDRAMRILRGLRGFGREAANDPMEWASVDHIIDQCLELQQARFETHVIDLRIHVDSGVPLILCRETQIGQILNNLISNAFDAIEQSAAAERWVALDVRHDHNQIIAEVTDSGPGVNEQFRPYLMDPFFTTKSKGLGMGIGLSLSRAIAQDHGGTLTLLSGTPHTTFSLSLPIDPTVKP